MTDKAKLEEIKKLADAMYHAAQYLTTDASRLHKAMEEYHQFTIHECKEEPVSEEIEVSYEAKINEAHRLGREEGMFLAKTMFKEPVSEDLEEAADSYIKTYGEILGFGRQTFKAGAKWQKNHLWKPADGDDLPEYEREVVVFTQFSPDDTEMMRVAIGHRPNPNGWDGKSLTTGKVEHYTPKTYGEGGWNIPNIVYWLDVELPKEIEL